MAGGERALTRSAEGIEDDAERGRSDLAELGFTAKDVLVGIAASGRTPYVLGAVAAAREMGAVTIGISCTPDYVLTKAVDIAISPLPGPEIVTGSTRLKAGTATKLVLHMISTATMIRLGYVYGNLMVNVQPTNEKLLDRACRIVSQATGADIERAAELLTEADGIVKTAIVMGRLGIPRGDAERRLSACGGRISEALRHG